MPKPKKRDFSRLKHTVLLNLLLALVIMVLVCLEALVVAKVITALLCLATALLGFTLLSSLLQIQEIMGMD